jgi:class 3 adenylate cyclase
MAARIKERVLAEKLGELRSALDDPRGAAPREWTPKALGKLAALIRGGDDAALFRVNPVRFAAENGIVESEAIDLFLHAARHGLFDMVWSLVCPTCGDAVESVHALERLPARFTCSLCAADAEAVLDDLVQVTFTVSPAVRDIAFHRPEALSIEDYHLKYHFDPGAALPGGARFVEELPKAVKGLSWVSPGQRRRLPLDVDEGSLVFADLLHHQGASLAVSGARADREQRLTLSFEGGKLRLDRSVIAPGPLLLTIENTTAQRSPLVILGRPPASPRPPLAFPPFLSGRRLLSTQTFRDLFCGEVIRGTGGIAVRDLTILFTDLDGSTALYEHLGDPQALSVVRQHFERLGRAIGSCAGACVKTIGDAVMASFLNPVDAVRAALEMNREIAGFNRSAAGGELVLKIGIHAGPCLAVTMNGRLDYFGQAVNVARRVQGLAGAGEIWVSGEVFGYPGVRALLKGKRVFGGKARLRGRSEPAPVYKIVPAAPAGADARQAVTASAAPAAARRAP